MPFPNRAEYDLLVYRLAEEHPEITLSTLRLYGTSAFTARLIGAIDFANGLQLRVIEALDFRIGRITDYSYTVYRGAEKICWYDAQPHPDNPDLASTFPHHRHEPPDIKQNRVPAPGISFTAPNLPVLIKDCGELGRARETRE
jgi:hypothetical protein